MMDRQNSSPYRWEPPPGIRTRRKFIRFSTGSASRRRINSTSSRSLSLPKAAKVARCLSRLFFTQRFPKDFQNSPRFGEWTLLSFFLTLPFQHDQRIADPRTTEETSAKQLVQHRFGARAPGMPALANLEFRGAVDFDVRLHSHLHARFLAHRRRHELVAGDSNHFSRQPHRARADDSQRPCWRALWNSLSCLLPRGVWNARRKHPGAASRAGGLRLVRHSNLDRWRSDLQNPRGIFSIDGRS